MESDPSRALPDEEPGNWVRDFRSRVMTKEAEERFMTQVRESAESVVKLKAKWEVYRKSSKKEIFELRKKIGLLEVSVEKEKEMMKQKEEALKKQQNLELKMKEEEFTKVVEEREKKVEFREVSVNESFGMLQEKDKESDLKQLLEAVVMRLVLEMQNGERITQINEQEKLLQDSMKKKHEKLMRELEAKKEKVDLLSKLTDEKRCELERKVTDFELKQIVKTSRIREEAELNLKKFEAREKELEKKEEKQKLKEKELNERERKIAETRKRSRPSLLAEKVRETDSLIPPAQRHKLIVGDDAERETYVLYENTSSDPASEQRTEAKGSGEGYQIVCGADDDVVDLDPEPYSCPEADFHDFHEMKNFTPCDRDILIYPRKGEIWSLFRDWTEAWINDRELYQPPYRYDFVEVLSDFDSEQGIGVAYLGAVKGFTSVYVHAAQHGIKQMMIPTESMLKFSHRVPHVKLNGDEKEGVHPGSFALDPAAIPRAYLKEESLVLDLGF